MSIIVLLILVAVVAVRYAAPENIRRFVGRSLKWAFIVGGVGFALGFFGPLIFRPEANQGPLLGIFITGPIGFLLGLAWGVFRAFRLASIERSASS